MVTISKRKVEPFGTAGGGGGGGGVSSRDLSGGKRLKLTTVAAGRGGTTTTGGGKSKAEEEAPLAANAMNLTEHDRKRANFSALSNTNGAVIKMTTNAGTGKPGDIKKIVIKNFKGKGALGFGKLSLSYFFFCGAIVSNRVRSAVEE